MSTPGKGDPTFDRVRPRVATRRPETPEPAAVDTEGKRALFSTGPTVPAFGSVSVECSRCGRTSVLGPQRALRTLVPSVLVPVLHGRHSWWLRCPACERMSWTRVGIRL